MQVLGRLDGHTLTTIQLALHSFKGKLARLKRNWLAMILNKLAGTGDV